MKLKWINIKNFGPFREAHNLIVDREVTVVTGKNDVGKSLLLKAIHLAFTDDAMATAGQINQERLDISGKSPSDDDAVLCEYEFDINELTISSQMFGPGVKPGDKVVCHRPINKRTSPGSSIIERGGTPRGVAVRLLKPPKIILLQENEDVRSIFGLNSLNSTESKFLKLGFGDAFNIKAHLGLPRADRINRVRRAEARLNSRLKEILATDFGYSFYLTEANSSGEELTLGMTDLFRSHLPMESRGNGVRKAIALMGTLLAAWNADQAFLVLIDEPETSLHADSQHKLRHLLEEIARKPNVQVIYATHSPSMINNMRPAAIRLLQRTIRDEKPVSIIINEAFQKNFVQVRSSLGLTPADSLLFAPITVIVEGATEVRCLPLVYHKLNKAGFASLQDTNEILAQIHFLDGEGDSYEYMVRLAKSQSAKPILFLDGDKSDQLDAVRSKHPDVPIILLDVDQEFENLIPEEDYLSAITKVYPKLMEVTIEKYRKYEADRKFKSTLLFSKRVERWLQDEFSIRSPNKHRIMEAAVGEMEIQKFNIIKVKHLLDKMRELLLTL